MGDQNRSPDLFLGDLKDAANRFHLSTHLFKILEVPFPTHINTRKEASWVDNLFIASPTVNSVQSLKVSGVAHEYFKALEIPLKLLEEYRH